MTADGSVTLWNEQYEEHYHSVSGAVEEAFKKFSEPCKIKELARKGKIRILDVCFGIGYNSAAAIEQAFQENPACEIEIVGIEKDPGIIREIQKLKPLLKFYNVIKLLVYEDRFGRVKLELIKKDAREAVKEIKGEFDGVFLDPFSPKKCPELWTKEFLKDIAAKMKTGSILATYSYAREVRDNLAAVGFKVSDGPVVGRRSPSTIAEKP